ncbi:hypothetical protein RCL1_007706 [Eukaryota sp. TZLM3-RCL]
MSDVEFEVTGAGASLTYPKQAGNVRKGDVAILKGHPCKITDVRVSKTGKHGHAKANFTGTDIFTNNKYEDMCPTSHNLDIPVVKRLEYQLLHVEDNFAHLLIPETGEMREDVPVPTGELGETLMADYEANKTIWVTVIAAMDKEAIVSYREVRGE